MKNKKGFTLIEILSVIVILGIIMIIAVPAVSNYLITSRKSSYMSDIKAYLETVRGEYEMKYYGDFLRHDEIMIVPVELVDIEQGGSDETPFGRILYNKSYVVIVPERETYQFYANFVDSAGYGVRMLPGNALVRDNLVKFELNEEIPDWNIYSSSYEVFGIDIDGDGALDDPSLEYAFCEERDSENAKKDSEGKILVLCQID